MAKRPVFVPCYDGRLVEEHHIEFQWFAGFSLRQKQRSIDSLHRSFQDLTGVWPVLEVSTKSQDSLGIELSAFNLTVQIDDHPAVLLETAFQRSKVFENGQRPDSEYLDQLSGREAKQYMRQFSDFQLERFECNGTVWPLEPKTAFYDWLYIKALQQKVRNDDDLDSRLCDYEAFTDIEYNPNRSVNCQARSCALYVAVRQQSDLNQINCMENQNNFLGLLKNAGYGYSNSQLFR